MDDWVNDDENINMLSFDRCRQTRVHAEITLEEYLNDIVHEIVHKMHHIKKGSNKTKNSWFHEALATNLSGQYYEECEITYTLEELKRDYNSVKNQYSISYTLGRYLFANYSHDFIIAMCKDESILDEFAPKLFLEVIDYQNGQKRI